MTILALSLLVAASAFAEKPQTPQELPRIGRPGLLLRNMLVSPGVSPDLHPLADNLINTSKNYQTLQSVYGVGSKSPATPEDARWATERMREESAALKILIPLGEAALQTNINASDSPAPATFNVSFAIFLDGERDWEVARARSNLAAAIGTLIKARLSHSASQEDITRWSNYLPGFRQEVARAEAAASADPAATRR